MDMDRLKEFITESPAGYAGFRAVKVSSKGNEGTAAEIGEVPFIFSVFFMPLIFMYTTWQRTKNIITDSVGLGRSRNTSGASHIFVMTSDADYRSYAFEEVGSRLQEQGEEVMFLCSPDATDRMAQWREAGFQPESFMQLLRFVSITTLLVHIVRSIVELRNLRAIVPDEEYSYSTTYVFNSIVLEHIKYLCLKRLTSDNPTVHSYSLMPYQVLSTVPERRYLYQHGVQRNGDGEAWVASRFFPANVLIWGEAWLENFEVFIHEKSNIQVVGSPWHDYLAESRVEETDTNEWDVVFIGGSQSTTRSEKKAEMYEELVSTLVAICDRNNWKLAFKLHPVEDSSWYDERGWGDHVTDFSGINDALKHTEIAVTHFSSAFVESIVLGTPIILNEAWSSGLSEIRPISGAYFTQIDGLEEKMKELLSSGQACGDIAEENRLADLGHATDRIVEEITR